MDRVLEDYLRWYKCRVWRQAQWRILHVSLGSATRWLTLPAGHPLGMSVRDFVDLLSEVKERKWGPGIHLSAS